MNTKQIIRIATKRMIKHIKYDLKLNPPLKHKQLCDFYANHYDLKINKSEPFWHIKFLVLEYFHRKASPIFKDRKLVVVHKKRKKGKKSKNIDDRRKVYLEYMRSYQWFKFAKEIKEKRGNKCEDCGCSKTLHAHHLTYDRFMNELESDIKILCKPCHEKTHGRKFKKH